MRNMTNLEYSFLVAELAPLVTGKHFDRIRKISDGIYRIKIANLEILCELGVRIHLTKYIEPTEQTDKFVEKVAKELDNAKLREIRQVNRDRIILFDFDTAQLVFEMFGDGNAILVKDGVTVVATKYESWTGREIKPNQPYSPPKNVPAEKLELTDKYVIVSLMKLPLGKDYVAEALIRSKIEEKKPGSSLSESERKKLEQELVKIKSEVQPVVFYENQKVIDFGLALFSKYSKFTVQKFKSLGEAADEYFSKVEKPNPKLEKLLSRLEKQQERLQILMEEEKEFKTQGDLVYANYAKIDALLQLAKAGKFDELAKFKLDKKEKSLELVF
ncbi:Uncharacterised protein [Candidatus Bilamarchaeum dharawalense]|uniref:Fibronectin-binding domain-containing protein n=1 Tax=Candidatus Bilamarchaeum dharawalense TaxID=2885759 RepID=A0A5E4LMZ1_9ARCH|nr:Uncharacterised protein [Candidatus Bilamarchaeum dharawalense]